MKENKDKQVETQIAENEISKNPTKSIENKIIAILDVSPKLLALLSVTTVIVTLIISIIDSCVNVGLNQYFGLSQSFIKTDTFSFWISLLIGIVISIIIAIIANILYRLRKLKHNMIFLYLIIWNLWNMIIYLTVISLIGFEALILGKYFFIPLFLAFGLYIFVENCAIKVKSKFLKITISFLLWGIFVGGLYYYLPSGLNQINSIGLLLTIVCGGVHFTGTLNF